MSRIHSQQVAKVTIAVNNGSTYSFTVTDWSLDVQTARVDVTQMGVPHQVWTCGPSRGQMDFAIVSGEGGQAATVEERIDSRLNLIDRWMKRNHIE